MLSKQVRDQRMIYTNFIGAFSKFAHSVISKHGCMIANSDIPYPFYNGVLSTQFEGNIQESIELIIKEFRDKPRCWWLTEFCEPQDLANILQKKGFSQGEKFIGMIYDLKILPKAIPVHSQAIIRQITFEELDEWINILAIGFHFSKEIAKGLLDTFRRLFKDEELVHYGAFMDNKMVGTASLFFEKETCGLYNLAVLPEFQHQKIAQMLKWHRLKIAKELRCSHAVIQSSKQGLSIDKQIGFEERMEFIPYLLLAPV